MRIPAMEPETDIPAPRMLPPVLKSVGEQVVGHAISAEAQRDTAETPAAAGLLTDCPYSERAVAVQIGRLTTKAKERFQLVSHIVDRDERGSRERQTRFITAVEAFSGLQMLDVKDTDRVERFSKRYYEAEAAQADLDAGRRGELLDTYESHPAYRFVDALGAVVGQQDPNTVILRRTILVLLEDQQIPPRPA